VVKDEYKAQFMLKLLFKDLGLALEMAGMDCVPLPIVGLAGQIYAQALRPWSMAREKRIFLPLQQRPRNYPG
jgi:3-hydroxyisobutyrate dehydrogenase-like beta-hydroxyacid dehydrogenase